MAIVEVDFSGKDTDLQRTCSQRLTACAQLRNCHGTVDVDTTMIDILFLNRDKRTIRSPLDLHDESPRYTT
jgi:hypothetical protein